jgi:HAD superfamily hydrolase (TIGR01549 family)
MGIQGVIFDLGHTLMHLGDTWARVFEQGVSDLAALFVSKGLDLDGQAFGRALLDRRAEGFVRARETMREVTAEDSMRWTFGRFGWPDPDPVLVRAAIDAFFAYERTRWSVDPESHAVLQQLAGQGLRLGLFSNATDDRLIQQLVDDLGLRPWLDPALSSAGTGLRKPDPEAFLPLLTAWSLPAGSVVMVGDTLEADILGGQRAGMRTVWYRSREDARQEEFDSSRPTRTEPILPDATIDRLGELPGVLARQ